MYRVVSLFAGIGGIDLAFERAGFKTVAQVEREPFCLAVLAKHWPDVPRIEDVKDAGRHNLPATDVLAGGFPCFAAGTFVLTATGYRPIETIKVGDLVLTHLGRWQPVTSVMQRDSAPLYKIKAQGTGQILTTTEHPFYARHMHLQWNNSRRTYERSFEPAAWIEAGDLTRKDFVGQVLPEVDPALNYSPELLWLIGRYLADGWRVQRKDREDNGRVVIACADKKLQETTQNIARAGYHATPVKEVGCTKLHIVNTDLYRFLKQFGKGAYGKYLPDWVFSLSQPQAETLVEGYLSGDGYLTAEGNHTFSTISPSLAYGFALLAQRALGVVGTVSLSKDKLPTIIEGRTVNQHRLYTVILPNRNRSGFIEGDYGWKLVRQAEPANAVGTVYNLSVAGDQSYVVQNAIVHNCQDISIAGKQAGIQKGNRSGLWFEFARIVGELRPAVVFVENVPAIATNGGTTVISSLAALGYDAEWGVVSAAAVGAPHRRERWFCVAYPNERGWHETDGGNEARLAGGGSELADTSEPGLPFARRSRVASRGTEGGTGLEFQPERCGELADAPRSGNAHQSKRTHGQTMGRAESGPGHRTERGNSAEGVRDDQRIAAGRSKDVADAISPRLEKRPGVSGNAGQERPSFERDRNAVGNANAEHGDDERLDSGVLRQRPQTALSTTSEPVAQSILGRAVNGLPRQLDGHRWPARPGEAQYEWEAPRTVKAGTVPNRAARLRALGNAVVPQQVEPIARAIYAYLQEQDL